MGITIRGNGLRANTPRAKINSDVHLRTATESPMDIVNRVSKLWIGAEVIGFTKGGDQMDVQIRLTDGTVVWVDGLVKPDDRYNS